MAHRKVELRVGTGVLGDGSEWVLAVTVHLPEADRLGADQLENGAAVLCCFPGGKYNRHYFDLREPGYSEAAHHVARGVVVVAVDHLRVGDSDLPELHEASLERVAEANDAVVRIVVERLAAGTLADGLGPVAVRAVIGAGQSMGGHIALFMQVRHRSFDGLVMLGSSVVCTRLPARIAGEEICMLGRDDPSEGLGLLRGLDWNYVAHWDDVPAAYTAVTREAYWLSATTPDAGGGLIPGYMAGSAALVNVPVLIAMGQRDVCQDPVREVAAFMSAPDVAWCVVPRMAHMHNFASTRQRLWARVSAFVAQVADGRQAAA